jgi:hypothetical protein
MSYMQVDRWIELEEQRRERVRRLLEGRSKPRRRPTREVLGFPIPIDRPDPPVTVSAELLARIDAKVAEIHAKGSRHRWAGRRAALLADRGLAVEVHQLCVDRSIAEVLVALDISRQGLLDVWLRHGLKAPRHSYREGGHS